jgi:hypothetical protein
MRIFKNEISNTGHAALLLGAQLYVEQLVVLM